MDARCSICGGPLADDDVAFAAGGRVLFHPCSKCAAKTRGVLSGAAGLLADKVKSKVREVVPPDMAKAAEKAVRIGRIIAEEDD